MSNVTIKGIYHWFHLQTFILQTNKLLNWYLSERKKNVCRIFIPYHSLTYFIQILLGFHTWNKIAFKSMTFWTVNSSTNMNQETFCLKWKTYQAHLVCTFQDLLTDGQFTDVILVSDDQIQMPAHKIVLSACSPVLKNLLLNNPHSNPLL